MRIWCCIKSCPGVLYRCLYICHGLLYMVWYLVFPYYCFPIAVIFYQIWHRSVLYCSMCTWDSAPSLRHSFMNVTLYHALESMALPHCFCRVWQIMYDHMTWLPVSRSHTMMWIHPCVLRLVSFVYESSMPDHHHAQLKCLAPAPAL